MFFHVRGLMMGEVKWKEMEIVEMWVSVDVESLVNERQLERANFER